MKRLVVLVFLLLVFDGALLLVGGEGAAPPASDVLRVGLVLDVGGRGDKSFNDSAYQGLERARDELGVHFELIEPGDGSDREGALRLLASRGFDLVIGTGFIFTDDLDRVARDYPDVRFAGVDYALRRDADGRVVPPPANLAALEFREAEGAFLVGALAALVSKTGTVGFIGGMDIPLIRRFEAGYRAGATHVSPSCEVLSHYAGVTPGAFKDPAKGKELALTQYAAGADVIFHAAGSTGLGVFEAARERDGLVIGVDSDQHDEAPGHVLTSMVKRVDNAVFQTVEALTQGRFEGGARWFGLAEAGVGYVHDERNRALVPEAARRRVEALRRRVIAGEIDVPGR